MELIPSVSIANLLQQRASFRRRMLDAEALIKEAEEIYNVSGIGKATKFEYPYESSETDFSVLGIPQFSSFHGRKSSTIPEALKGFDAVAWRMLMRESGMLTFMNAADRHRWQASIIDKATPELTLENIQATFTALHAGRGDMMEEGVVDLFRALSWEHKTNKPVKFGKKLILSRFCSRDSGHIDDLLRVLHIFDGKPQPDSRTGFASKFSEYEGMRGFTSEYADFRWFQNGNMHVKITRPDLIDKLNAVLAKRFPDALPAPK